MNSDHISAVILEAAIKSCGVVIPSSVFIEL